MKRFFAASEADPLCRGAGLDVLRFLAAAFIVLYHFELQAPVQFAALHPALTRGHLGTDFFLMLSGYVLGRTYGPRLIEGRVGPFTFLLRRITRVWPAHLIVLGGFAAVVLAAAAAGMTLNNPQAFQWSAFPAHAFLVQSWGLGVPYGWNTPTWSLSALIVCYAVFPVLWPLLARLSGPAALGASVLGLAAAEAVARLNGHAFFDLPGEFGVLRALPLFAFGAALARYGAPAGLTVGTARLTALGAAAALLGLQLLGAFDLASILLIGLIILVVGARAAPGRSALVARAAELSFALYISHSLVGMVWYRALGLVLPDSLPAGLDWAIWATAFPVALLFALVFHRAVDMPLQGWLNQRMGPASRSRPAAVAA